MSSYRKMLTFLLLKTDYNFKTDTLILTFKAPDYYVNLTSSIYR